MATKFTNVHNSQTLHIIMAEKRPRNIKSQKLIADK